MKTKKFSTIKNQLYTSIVDSYLKNDKKNVKKTFKNIMENKDVKSLYLFYDNFEKIRFDDKEHAKEYLNEAISILKEKGKNLPLMENNEVNDNEVYNKLDIFLNEERLDNLHERIEAKEFLLNHLLRKETQKEDIPNIVIENEKLLMTVLSNKFNQEYVSKLNESDKEIFKNIVNLSDNDIKEKINENILEIKDKIKLHLNESNDEELTNTLKEVEKELEDLKEASKLNLLKLIELNKNLE